DAITMFCGIEKDDIILEIGPGLGALTEDIMPLCSKLIAVEKDRGLSACLKNIFHDNKKLDIINKDILEYSIASLYRKHKKKIKVIGNLPFYITSPIIFHLLEYKKYIESIIITVQKEVAKRIISGPGSKDYGLLSCSVQYHTMPSIKMYMSKTYFFPVPEVDASLLELKIRKEPAVSVKDEKLFMGIIRSAFNQRRKTLYNALSKSVFVKIERLLLKEAFTKTGLDLRIRGEDLSLQQFALLSEELSASF
ncbi:MAG: 16S rRNA (adenine(1518)-N(6)/adenine(1519)-N(6))-dimethyltransferase RsmA, partial [Candidatus Omnitrophota bacterium]